MSPKVGPKNQAQGVPARTDPPKKEPKAECAARVQDASTPGAPSPCSGSRRDHQYTDAELGRIRAGNKDLARAILQAQVSYKTLVDQGATASVFTSAGNGGKPEITIVPPSLAGSCKADAPYDVQVHYHGQRGARPRSRGSDVAAGRTGTHGSVESSAHAVAEPVPGATAFLPDKFKEQCPRGTGVPSGLPRCHAKEQVIP